MAVLENHFNSSMIKYSEYNSENQILMIEFNNDAEYLYYNVPLEIYEGLISASSAGKFFNNVIKDNYEFEER